MFTTRISIPFDAGHRLLDYDGKCASPHGHSFTAEVEIEGRSLNELGLLVDFGDIKRPLKAWIDQHWDHAFLLNDQDEAMMQILTAIPEAKIGLFRSENPSVENMAKHLHTIASIMFDSAFRVRSVRIWEGQSQYAEYTHTEEW